MCGLFGTIRPHRYDPGVRRAAAAALLDLGYLAEERGIDSAGIAHPAQPDPHRRPAGPPARRSTWRRGNRSSAGGESSPPLALSPITCRATRGCGAISAPRVARQVVGESADGGADSPPADDLFPRNQPPIR